jgi:hypothetical protein
MKSLLSVFLCLSALFCFCSTKTNSHDTVYNSFQELKTVFKDPPNQFRTAPFWVWHDKVTKEQIDRDLLEYKNKGFGGAFIHPRYGLVTEYLSDEWFELVKYAVDKGRELGLYMWIYDENSFPSGFAGGHVPAQMPESYNQGAGLEPHYFDKMPENANEEYFIILQKEGDGYVKVTNENTTSSGGFVGFKKAYYDQRKWYAGYSYVDLIYPGVTEKFIDITMDGYEKYVGDEFGKFVPGVFTDEPNISTPRGTHVLRWTPDLFEQFEKRWGYDLVPHLVSLLDEVGDWKKVRHDYYGILLELFINRWSKPWFEYTEKNNLKWTGHYWEHGWPNPYHGGDNMAMYAYHQVPAIDMLFNSLEDRPDQFGNIRAVKELSSIANQFGRARTLSETYGAAGWELTFQDMKRLGDWEYVLGVNLMNQHLTYMSLNGDRKHDFPQSFSYHTPWWDDYKTLADYYARLSLVLSSGKQINNTLVLEPTTTGWMYYSPKKSHTQLDKIKDSFHDFLATMESYHLEYDLASENILKDFGSVKNGKIIVGEREYSSVIIPPTFENADLATFTILKQFLNESGKVFSFLSNPLLVDGKTSELTAQLQSTRTWFKTSNITEAFSKWPSKVKIIPKERTKNQFYHMTRKFKEGQLLFLTNFSIDETVQAQCELDGKSVILLNAFDGTISHYPFEMKSESVSFNVEIGPAGSLLLFIAQITCDLDDNITDYKWKKITDKSPLVIQKKQPNVLTLDYCDLELDGEIEQGLYFYNAQNKIWQAHGFDDNPWSSSSQFKNELVEKDNFVEGSGFKAHFTFDVEESINTDSLKVVVERPDLFKVLVNGNSAKKLSDQWWLDKEFGVYAIGEFIHLGKNVITVSCRPMSIFAELEPVYLLGQFSLENSNNGWNMTGANQLKLGPWKDQGYPFYSHGVSYSKEYQLDKKKGYKVSLNDWQGTLAQIWVNDFKVGIIGWQPHELDITEYIKDGANKIEVVVLGSLKNVLGPHHNVTRKGIVTPRSFKTAPDIQPAGNGYDTFPYGLFKDFDVYEKIQTEG